MHQPDIDATSTRPPAIVGDGGGSGWFREGDASSGVLGSILTATFMNDLLAGLLAMQATTGVSWTKGPAGDADLSNMVTKLVVPEVTGPKIRFYTGHFIQLGFATLSTGNGDVVNLPVGYPASFLHVMVSDAGAGCYATSATFNGVSTSSFKAYMRNQAGAFAGGIIRYMTFGI